MSEFEDKLNALLSDPGALEQIMELAQSLNGAETPEDGAAHSEPPPEESSADSPPFSPPDGIDPQLLRNILSLLSRHDEEDDRRAALLTALRPFLRPERQEKIDQAVRIARMTKLARSAAELFKGGGTGLV